MSKPDGGAAFPVPLETEERWSGMKLRDWFAGQVLIGLSIKRAGATDTADARLAYSLADAMIAEREAQALQSSTSPSSTE